MIARAQYAEAVTHFFLLQGVFLQIVVYCTYAEVLTEKVLYG